MKDKAISSAAVPVMLLLAMISGCGSGHDSDSDETLVRVTGAIEASLDELAGSASAGAGDISAVGLDTSATRLVLSELLRRKPEVIEASTVSPAGILVAIEPEKYQSSEGVDISGQAHVTYMREHHQPMLSNLFHTVEGLWAIALPWPLVGQDGTFLGSLSLLIDHVPFFRGLTAPIVDGTPYSVTIQQLDGTILYDADPSQVGKNVFSDPSLQAYPDLSRQVHEVVAAESGSGSYEFRTPDSQQAIIKHCQWTTIRRFAAEWRVAIFWSAE